MDMGSALLYKDVSREHKLAVAAFYAKPLGFGITAVLRGTHSLFMGKKLNVYL